MHPLYVNIRKFRSIGKKINENYVVRCNDAVLSVFFNINLASLMDFRIEDAKFKCSKMRNEDKRHSEKKNKNNVMKTREEI